jgi:hypothetical protein
MQRRILVDRLRDPYCHSTAEASPSQCPARPSSSPNEDVARPAAGTGQGLVHRSARLTVSKRRLLLSPPSLGVPVMQSRQHQRDLVLTAGPLRDGQSLPYSSPTCLRATPLLSQQASIPGAAPSVPKLFRVAGNGVPQHATKQPRREEGGSMISGYVCS